MGPNKLQLPHLETFAQAAELSSFTKAAKMLRLTQAAVSQRIQALEKSLDTSLFQRRGGRVLLTQRGQQLYEYAERILELHREARREVAGQRAPIVEELHVAASSIPGDHLLPKLLAGFGAKQPQIRVHASVVDSQSVIQAVERGEACLGFLGRKFDNPHLEFRSFAKDRLILVVLPGHPLAARKEVSLKDVAGFPFVVREPGSGSRHCFSRALERAGWSISDLRVVLELGSNESIKEAVLRGVGNALLSRYAVQKELEGGKLNAVKVRNLKCARDLFVARDRRRVLPIPAQLFLQFLKNHPVSCSP